jgi:hypothetical protein
VVRCRYRGFYSLYQRELLLILSFRLENPPKAFVKDIQQAVVKCSWWIFMLLFTLCFPTWDSAQQGRLQPPWPLFLGEEER